MRAISYLADYAIVWVVFILPIHLLDLHNIKPPKETQNLIVGLIVLAVLAYEPLFHGRFGATPGKMLGSVKVVAADGTPIGYIRAMIRLLGELLSG